MNEQPNKIATFSFDDGGISDLKAIDLCLSRGVMPTFYVISALVNADHMCYDLLGTAVGKAYKDVEVGSHSVSHPHFSLLDQAATRYELITSRRVLEDRMERPITLFSAPYGSYGPYTEPELQGAGYTWARAIHRAYDRPHSTVYRMPITSMLFSEAEEAGLISRLEQGLPVHVLCHSYFIDRANWWELLVRWIDLVRAAGYRVVPNTEYFENTFDRHE